MGIFIDSQLPAALSIAERKQQIRAMLSDVPALVWEGEVNANQDAYVCPFSGDRICRIFYRGTGSQTVDSATALMRMDAPETMLVSIYTGLAEPEFNEPMPYTKVVESGRGYLRIGSTHFWWASDEDGRRMMEVAPARSSMGAVSSYIAVIALSSAYDAYSSNSVYLNDPPVNALIQTAQYKAITFISIDGIRTHDWMIQNYMPTDWQNATTRIANCVSTKKMVGFFTMSNRTARPGVGQIYVDELTGKRYYTLLSGRTSEFRAVMEITQ